MQLSDWPSSVVINSLGMGSQEMNKQTLTTGNEFESGSTMGEIEEGIEEIMYSMLNLLKALN